MKLNAWRISAPWSIGAGQEAKVKHSLRPSTTIASAVELLRRGERSEAREAELALLWCTHRRERMVLVVGDVGPETLAPVDATLLEREPGALFQLPLAQLDRAVALDHLERNAGRGEEHPVAALTDPKRAAAAPRCVEDVRLTFIDPGRRHRAAEALERACVVSGVGGERED